MRLDVVAALVDPGDEGLAAVQVVADGIVMAIGIVAGRKQQRALAAARQRPATDGAGGGQQPAQTEKGTALHHGNSSGNGWLWLIAFLLTCFLAGSDCL